MNSSIKKSTTGQNASRARHARGDQAVRAARYTGQVCRHLAATGQVKGCDASVEVYARRVLQWENGQGTVGRIYLFLNRESPLAENVTFFDWSNKKLKTTLIKG